MAETGGLRDRTAFALRQFRLSLESFHQYFESAHTTASKQNLLALRLLDKIPGILRAEVPPLSFVEASSEHGAIIKALAKDYANIIEQPYFDKIETFHYKSMLGHYGYRTERVVLSKMEATDALGERNQYIMISGRVNNECGICMVFPENSPADKWPSSERFGNRLTLDEINGEHLKSPIKYLTGPLIIILTDGKKKAVSLANIMNGTSFHIVDPEESNFNIIEQVNLFGFPFSLGLRQVFISRLLDIDSGRNAYKIPLLTFAHELGHTQQSPKLNRIEREKNTAYFALRFARILMENGIDILSPFTWKEAILDEEESLAVYLEAESKGTGVERLSRQRKIYE